VQLHQPRVLEAFRRAGAGLLVVSFADLEYLKNWVPWWRDTFIDGDQAAIERTRFVADPGRIAYEAYGLGHHSARKVYSPRILLQYMKWAAEGKPVRKTDEDKLQRGGDFVVGSDGRVLFSHTGRDQSERPPVRRILAALTADASAAT